MFILILDADIDFIFCFFITIRKERDFEETPDCIRLTESECDLTHHLQPFNR